MQREFATAALPIENVELVARKLKRCIRKCGAPPPDHFPYQLPFGSKTLIPFGLAPNCFNLLPSGRT